MSDVKENNVEDLYLEHSQHNELMPERCSTCYQEDKELTEDKRREEAEQMERDDNAEVENLSANDDE
jgi:hypothetical protein